MTTDRFGRPQVPCGICGDPTPMTGTRRCDNCWEIERRVADLDTLSLARLGLCRLPAELRPPEVSHA